MKAIDELIEEYLKLDDEYQHAKAAIDEIKSQLEQLVGEGGAYESPDGVKVKVTPSSVSKRFDWKRYIKDHPEAQTDYMVKTTRKASVRITSPKTEKTDEYGWEV